MSLLVGDIESTDSLFTRLCQAIPGHEVMRCRLDEAFMMCNCHRFQLIWLVVSSPVSQETLSFTTTIRYMCMSRLNQTTRIIGVAEKSLDVDLQPHGIDVVLVEPVTCVSVRDVYSKWSTLDVPIDTQIKCEDTPGAVEMANGDKGSKKEEVKLPVSPLLAALEGVRNSYQPRAKPPTFSDHTTKEKMRRERIKDSCDQLRALLPYIRGRKTDMASVLEKCVDYLRIVNIALPDEFKSEVAEILGKDCQLTPGKDQPKSTPQRKRKRDLTKPPESPSPNFGPSSVENSPMYTPPATPGSETGSESVASPMSFTMDQSAASPQETCYVKLETTSYETSVSAPKALLTGRTRAKTQQIQSRNPHTFAPPSQSELYRIYHDDMSVPNPVAQRSLEYLSNQRARLPSCYSLPMFNRTGDLGLQPPGGYFQHNVPNNLMMPDKDGYRSSMEVDDPMGRFSHHNYSLAGNSSLSMDPLISYVNPNAVLPHGDKEKRTTEKYFCRVCAQHFTLRNNWLRHQRTRHQPQTNKRFTCPTCDRAFFRRANLIRHQQRHGNKRERVWHCEDCEKSFYRLWDWQTHQRGKHGPRPVSSTTTPTSKAQVSLAADTSLKEEEKKKQKKKSPTTQFEPDPVQPHEAVLPSGDSDVRELYQRHWRSIRTHFHRHKPIQDCYNYRLSDLGAIPAYVDEIYEDQPTTFTINYSFGYILRHKGTGQVRYYYPSTNNTRVLDAPYRVASRADLRGFHTQHLLTQDPLTLAQKQHPNTKWTVDLITNMLFFVHKLPHQPIGKGGVTLPSYLKGNKWLHTLVGGDNGPYRDYWCLFRCLAVHLDQADPNNCEHQAGVYYRRYLEEMEPRYFRGVPLSALDTVESLFQVNIQVYQLIPMDRSYSAQLIHRSAERYSPPTLRLNLYQRHFSYIKDMGRYARSFTCQVCQKSFPTLRELRRHGQTCTDAIRRKYPGGVFRNRPTIFETLADMGIELQDGDDGIFPYRACYDFEAYLAPVNPVDDAATDSTEWTAQHTPMSVSVNSNVPDYDQPVCFISTGDPQALVEDMMAYLNDISEISSAYLHERYAYILDALDERIDPDEKKPSYTRRVRDRFVTYMDQLPVLGFNSGNYDLNLIKQQLYPHLVQSGDLEYVIKRNNNHMALTTPQLKFLDIRNYLAPNYSYDKWVKAYDCHVTKGKFCYSYIDSLARLEETTLPPQHAFDNDLTHQPCTDAEYKTLQTVWREHGMRIVKDLLPSGALPVYRRRPGNNV
ncbi:uncharacterized protein LOC135480809 [Liolophura sinensis]|uniref:uncharacterized protein LOC135480809 n=1 Tax=Liolophura sinensis TaxID=3198878 RepID=UPI0031596F6D